MTTCLLLPGTLSLCHMHDTQPMQNGSLVRQMPMDKVNEKPPLLTLTVRGWAKAILGRGRNQLAMG